MIRAVVANDLFTDDSFVVSTFVAYSLNWALQFFVSL